jgi:hypothetical protein
LSLVDCLRPPSNSLNLTSIKTCFLVNRCCPAYRSPHWHFQPKLSHRETRRFHWPELFANGLSLRIVNDVFGIQHIEHLGIFKSIVEKPRMPPSDFSCVIRAADFFLQVKIDQLLVSAQFC